MKISFDSLLILDAIDRHGSFSAAAEALHRVPSALSHAVARLEDELGAALFIREGRRATLNEAGRTLLVDGRHLLRAAAELERRVQRIANGWEAELRIAVDAIIPVERLFPSLARFYELASGTHIRLSQEVLAGAWDALTSDRADLVIGAPGDMPARSGLSSHLLCQRTDFAFVVSPQHPLAQWPGAIPNDELIRHRAIVISDTARELDPRTVGLLEGQETLCVSDIVSKLKAQIAGLGVGHVPRYLATPALAAGQLVEKQLANPRNELPLKLAWKTRHQGKALAWFLGELRRPEVSAELTREL